MAPGDKKGQFDIKHMLLKHTTKRQENDESKWWLAQHTADVPWTHLSWEERRGLASWVTGTWGRRTRRGRWKSSHHFKGEKRREKQSGGERVSVKKAAIYQPYTKEKWWWSCSKCTLDNTAANKTMFAKSNRASFANAEVECESNDPLGSSHQLIAWSQLKSGEKNLTPVSFSTRL